MATQSWSQKSPIERRALLVRLGEMCARLASNGRDVFGSRDVCVEWIISLFGILIGSGQITRCFSVHGVNRVIYFPVVPVSALL